MKAAPIIWLDSCPSTNTAVTGHTPQQGLTVAAREQTAGRGQRGNSWEAQPGCNLTFSTMLVPGKPFPANRQFELSMAVALSVAAAVDDVLRADGSPLRAAVKWPNDIYVADSKIAGILIENSLSGPNLAFAIAGIGLNVNQREFVSDAPNPVSVVNLTGREHPLEPLLDTLAGNIDLMTRDVFSGRTDTRQLLAQYRRKLWRGTGEHPFREPDGEVFRTHIAGIDPTGPITLGNGRTYAFKEIIFVL